MTKALCFGTGVFLRGFFCDFAERAGIRVTMTSSTADGNRRAQALNASGGRYILAFRGMDPADGIVDSWRTVHIIDRAIPSTDWSETLALAADPAFSLVVSNVSEAGFRRATNPQDDSLLSPQSFPARLVAWLHERWKTLGDDAPVTILPCELFADNGSKLATMLAEVACDWQLPEVFLDYLANVTIADTLVDRIVPGEPSDEERQNLWSERLGADVGLPIVIAEPFALWAIRGNQQLADTLNSLILAGQGKVIVSDDISTFVQKKVRFLNGLHSAMAALGPHEFGVTTVREAVEHPELGPFLHAALFSEILAAVAPPLDAADARAYAEATWARFSNPFLVHRLAEINKGATAKWPVRLVPTIEAYRERFGREPERLTRCRAAFEKYLLS